MTRRALCSAFAWTGAALAACAAFLCVAVFAPASAVLYEAPGITLVWAVVTIGCVVVCASLVCGPCLHIEREG